MTDSGHRGNDPWDDPRADIHAGWHCYHWATELYEPVKEALPDGRCFRILRVGEARGSEGIFTLRHSWLAVLGCVAEKGFPEPGSGKEVDNDKCTVRLDGWLETKPKAYTPQEHGFTYNFQYTRVVQGPVYELEGWPGATGRRIGRRGLLRGHRGCITPTRDEPDYIYPP